jgi:hypothetical protein
VDARAHRQRLEFQFVPPHCAFPRMTSTCVSTNKKPA